MRNERINELMFDSGEIVRRIKSRVAHVLGWMGLREQPTSGIGFTESSGDLDNLIRIGQINLTPDPEMVEAYTSERLQQIASAHILVASPAPDQ